MSTADDPGLRISADLQLTMDGVHAVVVGDGVHVTVRTGDAAELLTRVRAVAPGGARSARRASRYLAQALDTAGLSLDVVDDRGTVVAYGGEARSRVAAFVLGTDRARFGPASLPAVLRYLRRDPATRAVARGAVTALVAAALLAHRRAAR